ncbi:MAG: aminotransferase class I/II-fold pyridoxal phosphate-dependent enzyme [Hyphomicrobium sp.]
MVGLNATAMLHDATAAIRTAWQGLQVKKLLRGIYQPSRGFGDLAGYTSVIKHRKVAERFNFADPFYRCHEESLGSKIFIDGREYLNFSSYDYIGLNRHPVVSQAAKAAIDQYGTSVSASRIVSGERVFHRELESALADLYEAQAALCFVSGHATNVSTIAALMESADLVVHDELAHNSILVGAKLSGATVRPFRHNDMAALEKLLDEERGCYKNALIVVEGLYSMDGDIPDLPRLIELKQRHNAWLMVDEAHALGVLGKHGRGVHEHFDIDPSDVDIWMGTLSKALAACGGYIAGSHELIELLKFRAAGQVYSVGMSPPVTAAASAALQLLKAEPERVARLQANGTLFLEEARAHGLDTVTSRGYAIVPIMVGDIVRAGRMTDRMLARGVNVLPIIYPAVPLKAARLRFFVTSEHTPEQIRTAVRIAAEELRKLA